MAVLRKLTTAALAAVVLGSCGTEAALVESPPAADGPSPGAERMEPALERIFQRYADGDWTWPSAYGDVTGLLTNREFRGKRHTRPLADAVVHGRIRDLRVRWGIDSIERPTGGFIERKTPSGDRRADVLAATVVVDVIDQLGPGRRVGDTATVWLTLGTETDVAGLRRGLVGLGEVVLFLARTPQRTRLRPGEFEWWGRFITVAAADGRLSLPVVRMERTGCDRALLQAAPTLEALAREAAKPTRAVDYPAGHPQARRGAPEPAPYGAKSSTC